jgi:hypothetical protein
MVIFAIKIKTQIVKWSASYDNYDTVNFWNEIHVHS